MISMIPNLSKEELEKLYDEIMVRLTAPFPEGTVEFKTRKPASAYIPSHPIQYRIRTAAGPYWSWRITTEKPIYHEETDEIEVRGVLTILNASAEGQGFATLERFKDTQKIKFYKEAIRAAASDALRDAADLFGIGHRDLAPYRVWAKNPGAGLIDVSDIKPTSDISPDNKGKKVEIYYCQKCGVVLSQEDLDYLKLVRWTIKVCKEHVPEHQKKKHDPNYKPKGG
jgi:hypothetical protein